MNRSSMPPKKRASTTLAASVKRGKATRGAAAKKVAGAGAASVGLGEFGELLLCPMVKPSTGRLVVSYG